MYRLGTGVTQPAAQRDQCLFPPERMRPGHWLGSVLLSFIQCHKGHLANKNVCHMSQRSASRKIGGIKPRGNWQVKVHLKNLPSNRCSAVAEISDHLATVDMGRKLGGLCPFSWGAGSLSNTMWPGPSLTFIPSDIVIHPDVWTQLTSAENWGLCHLFLGVSWATSNTTSPGPRPTSTPSGMPQWTWAENWEPVPLFGGRGRGRAGSPSDTMWPGPRSTSVPSFILMHQPFGHNTPTSHTDRQTYRTDRAGQRSDSIGQTVFG